MADDLTVHLRTRCQQRGVCRAELQTLFDSGDRLVPVGGGRVSITLSRRAAAQLRAEVGTANLDRASRRALVVDGNGLPITLLVPSGRHGRRYRHGLIGRQRARR